MAELDRGRPPRTPGRTPRATGRGRARDAARPGRLAPVAGVVVAALGMPLRRRHDARDDPGTESPPVGRDRAGRREHSGRRDHRRGSAPRSRGGTVRKLLAITAAFGCLSSPGRRRRSNGRSSVWSAPNTRRGPGFLADGLGERGTLRLSFTWASSSRPGPDAYDWSRYDAMSGRRRENGIRVLPTIYGLPGWVAARPNTPRPPPVDRVRGLLRAAVARYGPNGTFWALNPLVPKLPISHWQLLTRSTPGPSGFRIPIRELYKPLLVHEQAGIKGADPRATLILAGMFVTPGRPGVISMIKFLSGLYRLKARACFDSVAVHPYST